MEKSSSVIFWWNEAEEVIEATEVVEAVEVIEASDVIMSVEVMEATEVFRIIRSLKINNAKARIVLFWCFEKNKNLKKLLKF